MEEALKEGLKATVPAVLNATVPVPLATPAVVVAVLVATPAVAAAVLVAEAPADEVAVAALVAAFTIACKRSSLKMFSYFFQNNINMLTGSTARVGEFRRKTKRTRVKNRDFALSIFASFSVSLSFRVDSYSLKRGLIYWEAEPSSFILNW